MTFMYWMRKIALLVGGFCIGFACGITVVRYQWTGTFDPQFLISGFFGSATAIFLGMRR